MGGTVSLTHVNEEETSDFCPPPLILSLSLLSNSLIPVWAVCRSR